MEIRGMGKRDRASEGVLPRLQNPLYLPSVSGTGAGIQGFHSPRQVTQNVEGCEFAYDDVLKSNKIVPWTTGPQLMQTQAHSGGFSKPRDVCNMTYYDKSDTSNKRFEKGNADE